MAQRGEMNWAQEGGGMQANARPEYAGARGTARAESGRYNVRSPARMMPNGGSTGHSGLNLHPLHKSGKGEEDREEGGINLLRE